MEQAGQVGEVTIPGEVQETCRPDTSGHALMGMVALD